MAITTAVVPVAGLATRLRPLSRGVPKALLPVAGKPVIQHIVDELAACGVERVVLVTGRGRAGFEAHFGRDGEAGAPGGGAARPHIAFVEQPEPLGLADAILRGAAEVEGPFVVALGDALLGGGRPARTVERLVAAIAGGAQVAVAVEEVARADTQRYGIVVPGGEGDPFPIVGMVEKPAPDAAPSRLAVAGRYAATPALVEALRATPLGAGGELMLADALAALPGVVGVRLGPGEERFDVGNVPGYCAAFVEHALTDPELGPDLRARARALLDAER